MTAFRTITAGAVALACLAAAPAAALDKVRITNAQEGFWDQNFIEWGAEAGIFEKHGIDLEVIWTDGGANAQQAVISGSVDMSFGTGVLGVISAWAQGAPVEITAATMTGASDLFWYARADSGITSMADTQGRTVAYSRPGSSTNLIAAKLVEIAGTDAELVGIGGPAASLTAVMSGQIDVGWSSAPFGYDRIAAGELVRIATGNDVPGVAEQVVRVQIANRNFLQNNPDVVRRYFEAFRETLEWAYAEDEALQKWADIHGLDLETARQIRDEIYPREAVAPYPITGIEANVRDAVETGRLDAMLSPEDMERMLAVAAELHGAEAR